MQEAKAFLRKLKNATIRRGIPNGTYGAIQSPPRSRSHSHSHSSSPSNWTGLKSIIFGSSLNILLLAIPFCFTAQFLKWSPFYVFTTNFLAIIPLAFILGKATEELALHTNQMIGGLLNATFGNAVEMIMVIMALRANLVRVVQASLLGSILSNLLLVLGMCLFTGGLYHSEQKFNVTGASADSSLLLCSCLGLILPTTFDLMGGSTEDALKISHVTAIILGLLYFQFLLFQLKTHVHLFADDDEKEESTLTVVGASILLATITFLISIFSEWLVDSIDGVTETMGISQTFIGIILLPIVGNAAEHLTAVSVAVKDKMDLSMAVAVGSSIQIALLVVPVSVLLGWAMGVDMSLDFHPFESVVLLLSVLIVNVIVADGQSNWLEGSMLMSAYVIIGVSFYYYND